MIKALLFDIDGVITHFDFGEVYVAVACAFGLPAHSVSDYFISNLDALLVGANSVHDSMVALGVPAATTPEQFLDVWTHEITKRRTVDAKLLDTIRALRTDHTVAALSNLTETRYYADLEVGLYDHFDAAFLSHEVGLKKPDPAFFRHALSTLGVDARETIFIDDNPRFVAAATVLGIHAIHFQHRDQLLQEFSHKGISV